ncbi:MAG: recombinase family protein [Lachnospiraceae bacterium]|nr:recombinase family protein [Lachnospiraceae bacterium]
MQTAAAYIRVSTEDQTEYSPDSQRSKLKEYAAAHDLLLPEPFIYLDEGISGRSAEKRPAFLQMIGTAKQKPRPFDLILVWKFSRFARSRQDSILYKSMLRKECGIDVVSITEQLSGDPTSILVEALLEAMDEYYSINLSQEVRRGMNEKFSRGGVVSVPPFGYRMGSGRFEPDPVQSPFVRWIFQDFLNGASFRQIAAQLNAWNVRTARGNLFESRSVKYILTNPVYLGKQRRSLEGRQGPVRIVDGAHIPLVDLCTYEQVQERIAAGKNKLQIHSPSVSSPFMLYGLVRCSFCGSTLTSAEKGRSLQCPRYAKGLCPVSHHVRLDKLTPAVLSQIEADLNPVFPTVLLQNHPPCPGKDPISLLLEREERRLARIRAAYEAEIDSLEEYQTKKAACSTRIQKLREEAQNTAGQQATLPAACPLTPDMLFFLLRSDWMSEQAKNECLRALLSHITFYRRENAFQIHYNI